MYDMDDESFGKRSIDTSIKGLKKLPDDCTVKEDGGVVFSVRGLRI